MANSGFRTTIGKFAPLVKPEEGGDAFYDEDGNLKYDPDDEIIITKTIEGKQQDGSYQQRISITHIGNNVFAGGKSEIDILTDKNIVVTETAPVTEGAPVAETKATETPQAVETNILTLDELKDQKKRLEEKKAEKLNWTPKKEALLKRVNKAIDQKESKEEPVAEVKTEPTLSKKDQEELDFVSKEIDATESKIIDIQEQIEIEKGNVKEEKERIQEEKAKVKASKMPKAEKTERLEELDAEWSDIKDDHDDLIDIYNDDLKAEKSDLKRYNNRKTKIQQKAPVTKTPTQPAAETAPTPVAETKVEPTAKPAEEQLSPRAEKMKNNFVDSYNNIPTKNNKQRGRKYQYIADQQSSLDPEERQAAKSAMAEISANEKKATEESKVTTKAEPTTKEEAPKQPEKTEEEKIADDISLNTEKRDRSINRSRDVNEEFPILEYNGNNKRIKIEVDYHNTITSRVNKDGSWSDAYANRIIQELIVSAGPRKSRIISMALRNAGFNIPASYDLDSSTKTMGGLSLYMSDSSEMISNEYSILDDKVKATEILTKAANKLGVKVATLETEAKRPKEVIKSTTESKTESKVTPKTEVKPTPVAEETKAETKPTTQGAKVKARTQRGGDLEYTVKSISKDGKTATVQAPDRLKSVMDTSQGMIRGEVLTLPIKENINGERIVETDKGTTVYLDRVIAPAETTLFETKKKEEAKEKKDGRGSKKSVTFYKNTGREINRFTLPITMEKNNRTNQWEVIGPDGNKIEYNEDQQDRLRELQKQAQLEYNKQNGIEEEANEVQQEAIEENKGDVGAEQIASSDIGKNASEAFVEPTDTQPRQKRKRTKSESDRDYQATARRGTSTSVTQSFIDKMGKAFPKVSIFNDQDQFDTIANQLGRPPGTAAILYKGVIYLNPSQANVNTALEEYAHVYLLVMKTKNPNLYRMGIELVRKDGQQYLDEVKNDPGYSDIANDPEAQSFEALSKMIADRGEAIEDARQKSKVKEFLKDLWRGIYQFISGNSKIKENVDTLESYVDKVSRELLKSATISDLSISDLSKLQNKENIGNINVSSSIIDRTTNRAIFFNRVFRANRGISQSIADRVNKAQNMVKIFENRANAVLKDFNANLKEYHKKVGSKTDAEKLIIAQKIDRALKDSEFRNNWFSSDADAEALIKPSVVTMRNLIDKLSTDLKNSGMLTDDLELTINGNLDMYVNTSYMFYSPSYTGEWLDVFTPTEKDKILDYFRKERVQPAKQISYRVNSDGSVNASFENSFGDILERRYDSMNSFKSALADTSRYNTRTGGPSNKKLDVDKLSLSDSQGKLHEININQGLDISSIDRFSTSDSAIVEYINNQRKEIIEKKTSAKSFMFGIQNITDTQANKILKRKKNMRDVQKLLLKEVQDPSANFLNTIRKQSELLFKRSLEQEIINSGYLARTRPQGNLNKQLNKPGSLLDGLYVTPEMHDLLTNKRIGGLSGGLYDIVSFPSIIMKAIVTIASPGSNAANFGSGFIQTLMTGNNPFSSDMNTAMRALQEQAKVRRDSTKIGGKEVNTEDLFGLFFNTIPTVIRGIVNVSNIKPKGFKQGISQLSEDQKQQYGVNSFDQLSDQDKARVILEELIENGAISPGIDSGIVMDLIVNSLQNKELSLEQKNKIFNSFKKKIGQSLDVASNTYQFSDSMFKAIVYMQEKAKRYDTYGSVMKKKGMSDSEIETEIRRMSAEAVKKQMPSYDRSPEFIKFISRMPLMGSFVQFDYQSKVNGFNILADAVKLMNDGREMIKDGYTAEGTKLLFHGAKKGLASTSTWFMSYGIAKLASSILGGFADDDDDETVRILLPEYRRYSPLIHLDSNREGDHEYIDIGRIDPQSLYLKYMRAFSEGGMRAGIYEIIKPYISSDIFYGGVIDTFISKRNKFGDVDRNIELMDKNTIIPYEKLMYFLNERIAPSTAFAQVDRIIGGLTGEKQGGVPLKAGNEILNYLFGFKQRTINLSEKAGKHINYGILKEMDDEKTIFQGKLNTFEDKEEDESITEKDIEALNKDFEEFKENSNQIVQDARDMVSRLKDFGMSEETIRKSLDDANTPKYLITKLMADEFTPIKYDEEGSRIQFKKPTQQKTKRNTNRNINRNINRNTNRNTR